MINNNRGFGKVSAFVCLVILVTIGSIAYTLVKPTITLGQGVLQPDGSYQFLLSKINSYNFVVDWGDGKVENVDTKCPPAQLCGLAPWINHTFPSSTTTRTYQVIVVTKNSHGPNGTAQVEVVVPPQNNEKP